MEQKPQDAWFYSQAGTQKGPVNFQELQAKIAAKELHPRKDLVWKDGMANWTAVAEMGDVFDLQAASASEPSIAPAPAPTPEPAPAPAPTPEPAPSPEPTPAPEPAPAPAPEPAPAPKPAPAPTPKPEPKPLPKPEPKPVKQQAIQQPTPEPKPEAKAARKGYEAEVEGANRGHFFFGVYLFPTLWIIIVGFIISTFGPRLGQGIMATLTAFACLVPVIVAFVVTLKRFTNLAMSRWWILGNLVPIVNLWVGYRLFACPYGYGAGRKMDGLGIFLAILYWLSLIGLVAGMVFIMLAFMTRIAEDPNLRQEINNFLIKLRDQLQATQ